MNEIYTVALKESEKSKRILGRRNAFWDFYESIFSLRPIKIWQKVLSFFRKFRFLSILIRLLQWAFFLLQSGATLLVSTLFFFVLLPFSVAAFSGLLLAYFPDRWKKNRQMKTRLKNRRVYVLFYRGKRSDFLAWNLCDLATKEGTAVLLVSPFWLSPKGAFNSPSSFFLTVRTERKNLYYLRRYYFFSLRKSLLADKEVCYIY